MAPLDRRHRNREVLTLLLEKASVQGYLTTDDLLELSPEVGEDAERLSVIMLALRHRGVDVLDPEASEAPPNELVMLPGLEPLIEPEPVVNDTLSDDTVGMYLKEMSRVPLLKADEKNSKLPSASRMDAKQKEICFTLPDGKQPSNGSVWKPSSRMGSWRANTSSRPIPVWWSASPSVTWDEEFHSWI
jgi:Sigma-70 factor, region 1.